MSSVLCGGVREDRNARRQRLGPTNVPMQFRYYSYTLYSRRMSGVKETANQILRGNKGRRKNYPRSRTMSGLLVFTNRIGPATEVQGLPSLLNVLPH